MRNFHVLKLFETNRGHFIHRDLISSFYRLQENEVLIIQGFERYSDYTGYASNFKFSGDHKYQPLDGNQDRFPSTLVAMNALNFR